MPNDRATLRSFYFDRDKASKILSAWQRESSKTFPMLEEETGISENVLKNMTGGRTKGYDFEAMFKFAVATGHTFSEFVKTMVDPDEVDFSDRVFISAEQASMPRPVQNREKEARCSGCSHAQQYETSLSLFKGFFEQSRKDMIESKDEIILHKEKTISRLRTRNTILIFLIAVETIGVMLALVFDAPNHLASLVANSLWG